MTDHDREAIQASVLDRMERGERLTLDRFDIETRDALAVALTELAPASQLVLRMHFLHELSYAEISEALEIPLGTVKSRAAYGLASLRTRLRHTAAV